MIFKGRSFHTMDSKGRISIPARFRNILRDRYDNKLVVTNKSAKAEGRDETLVWLVAYPRQIWNRIEENLMRHLMRNSSEERFARYFIGAAADCNMDSQGRILLPANLREEAGLVKEVCLSGLVDHFEIWDKETLEFELKYTRSNFDEYNEVVSQASEGVG